MEEGGYLATSDELQRLVAQGQTVAETMEIAQDVGRKLIESGLEHGDPLLPKVSAALKRQRGKATIKIPVRLFMVAPFMAVRSSAIYCARS
ncbi:MAG TPA: type II toxin-antitoxin system HicB family antitoxin [Desulfobacterales bacterium]|nr:type II toxin-antitoxin system HicB family antitoxin [Desulfobacterales bacterium]